MPQQPTHALVLTGRADQSSVTASLLEAATVLAGAAPGAGRWLAEGCAAEVALDLGPSVDRLALSQRVSQSLGAAVDVNLVPLTGRRKHLLIADMDSTMIEQECIDEMAAVFGLKEQVSAITERAMRGDLAFEGALLERLALLQGLDEAALERVHAERITLMPGAKTLISTMRANGAYTALVSGGFTFFTSRVARAIGFDVNRANMLTFADGRMTGGVAGPILGREAKRTALQEFAAKRGLPLTDTLAVGDGANDLDMIRAAGLGVAYRAKPVVAAEADAAIAHGDLTALLYLQGYAQADFAHVV
jgi:phosphoserine phosphatase